MNGAGGAEYRQRWSRGGELLGEKKRGRGERGGRELKGRGEGDGVGGEGPTVRPTVGTLGGEDGG